MAKVANLMANHNGNPTAVASLYDEKISEVETYFVDSDTLTAIYFDTDTGIVDKCDYLYDDWHFVTNSSDTALENVVTDTSVSGYSLAFDSSDKARAYISFYYNESYTSGRLKTIEGIFFVDTNTSTSGTSVLFSYTGYNTWGFDGGSGKGNFIYYLSCSYTDSSASLNYSFMGTTANVEIPLSTLDEPFHVAYSADFVNKKAYIFLNGSLLAIINDKIRTSGKTGSTNYYFMSTYILRIIALGCMCTASIPSGEINPRNYSYGITTANTLNGRCLDFRVSLATKYTEDFIPYKSTVFAPNLPVKGNLCVRALTPLGAKTKVLLHFDESPTKDECGNEWTSINSPELSTDTKIFGNSSLYLNGSSYAQLNDFTLGGQDLTIDFWGYMSSATTKFGRFIEMFRTASTQVENLIIFRYQTSANIQLNFNNSGNKNIGAYLDAWHHFAVVYQHDISTTKVYVDGVCKCTVTNKTFSRLSRTLRLGQSTWSGEGCLNGYIDEFRILDGVALWTENFTPPDKPYIVTQTLYAPLIAETSMTPEGDKTISLKHFDDPDNPAKDECDAPSPINDGASFFINTETAKFGGGCLQFIPTGSTSNQYAISSNPVYFGGADFTIDFWVSGHIRFYTSRNSSEHRIAVQCDTKQLLTPSGSYTIFGAATNDWRHFALVYNRAEKLLYVYENGVSKGSYALDYPYLSRRAFFYCNRPGADYPPRADELRIVHGLQVWTSDFTPPTQPYTLDTYNGKNPPCIGVRNQGNNFYTV